MLFEKKVNVLIAESDKLTRVTLKKMVDSVEGLSVCADFDNAEDCLYYLKNNPVDLVIMDICLPYMNGIEASKFIRSYYPSVKLMVLTVDNTDAQMISSLLAYADGYFVRDLTFEFLKKSIEVILCGQKYIDKRIQLSLFNYIYRLSELKCSIFFNRLTFVENQFVSLILRGFALSEIAKIPGIRESNFSIYFNSILNKLQLFTGVELVGQEVTYDLF